MSSDCDYPARDFQGVMGKTVAKVEQAPDADEGLLITFTDGSALYVGFAGCAGSIVSLTPYESLKFPS